MDDFNEFIKELADRTDKEVREQWKKNLDISSTTNKDMSEMLDIISKCEYFLDHLLTKTESCGGFGSFYPKKCLEHLMTIRTIIDMEIGA